MRRVRGPLRGRWLELFGALAFGAFGAEALATEAPKNECLRTVELKAGQRATVAVVAVEDWTLYTSRGMQFVARVTTADGQNTIAEAWVKHTDAVRWGANSDLKSAKGPIIRFKDRFSFWGSGGVELIVRARNTATTLCICTIFDPDEAKASYPEMRAACERHIAQVRPAESHSPFNPPSEFKNARI